MAEADIITGKLASGGRLDKALADATELSRERIKGLIAAGAVTIGKTLARSASAKVQGEERFAIALPPPEPLAALPQDIPLDIVFEDEDLLVINKQPGLTVHPGAGVSSGTLMNGLLYHRPGLEALPRAGIVHRLDKDTSGLMVVAGSLSAHKVLTEAILHRSLSRSYEAVCEGVLISGQDIDAPIGRDPRNRLKKAVRQDGKNSLSIMRIIKRYRKHSLVKVSLATGRTHQIRVHMQSIGHPLVGDRRYGCRYLLPKMADEATIRTIRGFKRQALHSRRLEFAHPRGGSPQRFVADRPGDMEELIDALELDFEKYS